MRPPSFELERRSTPELRAEGSRILHRALRKAAKDKLIPFNVAADLDGKPRRA